MMLMYRVASAALVLALAMTVVPHGAAAQYQGDPAESRGPRFLLAMAERSKPVPVDLARSAVLRRRAPPAVAGAPPQQAPAGVPPPRGLSPGFSADVVAARGPGEPPAGRGTGRA